MKLIKVLLRLMGFGGKRKAGRGSRVTATASASGKRGKSGKKKSGKSLGTALLGLAVGMIWDSAREEERETLWKEGIRL